jgi:hypothetical protein
MAYSSRSSQGRRRFNDGPISLPAVDGPTADGDASQSPADAERSLRSFVFEVSAGRARGVADATDLPASGRRPPGRVRRLLKATRRTAEPREPDAADTNLDAPVSSAEKLPAGSGAAPANLSTPSRPAIIRRRQPRRRRLPACAVSSSFHLLVLVVLVVGRLPGRLPLDELIWAPAPAPEEVMFTEVDIEAAVDDPVVDKPVVDDQELLADLIDPGQAALGQADSLAAFTEPASAGASPVGSLGGELGALFGSAGAGATAFDAGLGDAPLAKFFGQEIEGRRIVFVLDNSGSMQGGRLETVISELLRCVEALAADQQFYVIFHSDTVYPLFYPDPVDRYVRPTDANKRMLALWLDSVELCLGDSVDEALAAAAMIEPDTVFLLSDGRIQGERTIRFLLDGSLRNFPIHTFAVGIGASAAGRRNLADIAAAHGGQFREADVPDAMQQLARRRPRRYHSETPGAVWGRHVRAFGSRR